jgi:hypothetical protein
LDYNGAVICHFHAAIIQQAQKHVVKLNNGRVEMKIIPYLSSLGLAAVLAGIPFVGHAAEDLSGDSLKKLVTGRTVYLSAPLGGEMPLNYRADGSVNGNGTAVGLGRLFAARETGRWFMNGKNLCQQFPTWYSGVRLCFTVKELGNNKIRWTRDNGETGVARVGD